MTELAIVIPFKGGRHKSRLSGVMGQTDRTRFSLLMLREVLETFKKAGLVSSCHIVSSDPTALRMARSAGATPLRETANRGVNAAVREGVRTTSASEFLVVPADLPLLRRSDLDRVMNLKTKGVDVVISPSLSFDGTNLLFFSRGKSLKLSYDRDSFWNHVGDAAASGLSLAVYTGSGVVFDVDSVDDLQRLAGSQTGRRSVAFARKALGVWASS